MGVLFRLYTVLQDRPKQEDPPPTDVTIEQAKARFEANEAFRKEEQSKASVFHSNFDPTDFARDVSETKFAMPVALPQHVSSGGLEQIIEFDFAQPLPEPPPIPEEQGAPSPLVFDDFDFDPIAWAVRDDKKVNITDSVETPEQKESLEAVSVEETVSNIEAPQTHETMTRTEVTSEPKEEQHNLVRFIKPAPVDFNTAFPVRGQTKSIYEVPKKQEVIAEPMPTLVALPAPLPEAPKRRTRKIFRSLAGSLKWTLVKGWDFITTEEITEDESILHTPATPVLPELEISEIVEPTPVALAAESLSLKRAKILLVNRSSNPSPDQSFLSLFDGLVGILPTRLLKYVVLADFGMTELNASSLHAHLTENVSLNLITCRDLAWNVDLIANGILQEVQIHYTPEVAQKFLQALDRDYDCVVVFGCAASLQLWKEFFELANLDNRSISVHQTKAQPLLISTRPT